jgi:long-chain acyl-CoA synthetase
MKAIIKSGITLMAAIATIGCCCNKEQECNKECCSEELSKELVVTENILTRRSVRDYKPEAVDREQMAKIIECGIYAPSAMNKQTWAVRVVDAPDFIEGVTAIAVEQMPQLKGAICIEDFTELWSKDEILKDVMPNLQQLFRAKYPQGMKRKFVHYEVGGPDDLNTISYTSGTTSSPKGIMLSNNNISSNITFGVNRIKMPLGSSIVSMLPLAHLYGLAFEFIYPICSGATIYFLGKMPTPTLLMQAFRDVRPYMLITVPLVLEKIIRNKVIPTLEKPALKLALKIPGLSSIIYTSVRKKILASFGGNMKHIIIGGAAISGPIEVLLKQIKLPYTVGYGMTECGPLIGYEDWYDFAIRSCGKPVDGMEVRIDSTDPQNVAGEIQVCGDNVMLGYYKQPDITAATFTDDGYMKTGDLGVMDK